MIVQALRGPLERRDGLPTSLRQWRQLLSWGVQTDSGPLVNENTALAHATVFACVRILSKTIAALPLQLRRRLPGGGSAPATDDPRYLILARRANQRQTKFQAVQFMAASYYLRGNALALKRTARGGQLEGYYPIRWDQITPDVLAGELVYRWSPSAQPGDLFRREQVIHAHSLSTDGVVGLSPIAVQREAIGSGLAMQQFNARLFSNGARPAGVLTLPGALGSSPEERAENRARLAAQWEQLHGGVEASNRVAILEDGMKWEATGLDPQDAQFLEGRRFNASEIAGWYGVPLHLILDTGQGDFSIDTLSREFVFYHLLPDLVNLEQQLERDLLNPEERETLYVKFKVDALLRGKAEERSRYYNAGITGGWLTRNEARDLEDMNPLEGLDEPLAPLNMARVDETTGNVLPMFPPSNSPAPAAPSPIAGAPPVQRSATDRDARARLAAKFVPAIEDLTARLLRSELRELEKIVSAHFGEADGPQRATPELSIFFAAVERFHDPEGSWRRWALTQIRPLTETLGSAIFELAAAEIPADTDREGVALFYESLAAAFAARYAVASLRSLENAVAGAPDAPGPAARGAFDVWREERPARVAAKETVYQARRTAVEAYRRSGVTRIRWRLRGGDSCPFCRRLDGAVVGIDGGSFVGAGEKLEAQGRPTLLARDNVLHPPLHKGCVCDIEPEG